MVKNEKTTLLIGISIFLPLAAAFACGACVDRSILIKYPFTGLLIFLCVIWLIAGRIFKLLFKKDPEDKARYMPRWFVVVGFAVLFIVLSFLSMGSVLFPSLVTGSIWLIYIIVKTITGFIKKPTAPLAKAYVFFHLAFIVLALPSIILGFLGSRSTADMISMLEYPVQQTSMTVLPKIIDQGEPAVEPLINALENSLVHPGSHNQDFLRMLFFCLARIDGTKAETYLNDVIKKKVDFSDLKNAGWQKVACFSYAECAKERAVPELTALYDRCDDGLALEQRWSVIVALARTASQDGILFALDHMDVLIESGKSLFAGDEIDIAAMTVQTLLLDSLPQNLAKLPVYRYLTFVDVQTLPDPSTGDLRAEFYWTASDKKPLLIEDLEKIWEENKKEIRNRWLKTLAGRSPDQKRM